MPAGKYEFLYLQRAKEFQIDEKAKIQVLLLDQTEGAKFPQGKYEEVRIRKSKDFTIPSDCSIGNLNLEGSENFTISPGNYGRILLKDAKNFVIVPGVKCKEVYGASEEQLKIASLREKCLASKTVKRTRQMNPQKMWKLKRMRQKPAD